MGKNILLFLVFLLFSSYSASSQAKLFWADWGSGKIAKSDLDGNNSSSIIRTNRFKFIAIDSVNSKIYWTDAGTLTVSSCNLDGSDEKILIADLEEPKGICVNEKNELFIVDNDRIVKYNTCGNFLEVIHEELNKPVDIVIFNSKIFWGGTGENNSIEYSNLDGTSRKVLTKGVQYLEEIDIDPIEKKIYWVQYKSGFVSGLYRINLDGTHRELFIDKLVRGFSIDAESGFVYWSEWVVGIPMHKTKLTNIEDEIFVDYSEKSQYNHPKKICIDKKSEKLFFIAFNNHISSINLKDGKSIKVLVKSKYYSLYRFDIDTLNKMIYWINGGLFHNKNISKIIRSDIEGNNKELLLSVSDIGIPVDLALSIKHKKVFISDKNDNSIKRMNLDGSGLETIISGLDYVTSLFVDENNSKLYWIDPHGEKIQRSNLDGTNIEDVITKDLKSCWNIAISNLQSKIYWTNISGSAIYKANLDGSNIEKVYKSTIPNFNRPKDLFIDEVDEKIYFSTTNPETIKRCDFNGENVEDLKMKVKISSDLMILYNTDYKVDSEKRKANISINPNPFSESIHIKSDIAIKSFSLLNSVGQLIKKYENVNYLEYCFNDFPLLTRGIYFLYIELDNGLFQSVKLVKM